MIEQYTNKGPGRYEGLSPFQCFLVDNVDNAADQTSGDVESPPGWFAQCGRYVVSTDGRGFWYADRHATRALAAADFARREAAYSAWFDDDDMAESWADDEGPTALSAWAAEMRAAEDFYADGDLFGDDGTC